MKARASIKVLSPGFLTSVQDLGRFGYAHLGVSASGAADSFSLRIGNLLLGNPHTAAALEMTLVGGQFEFDANQTIALTGSDFEPRIDNDPVPLWTSLPIRARQKLTLASTKSGARCYLCVSGGIDVPPVLGSASTHLMTTLGGYRGSALKQGDSLPLGSPIAGNFKPLRVESQVVSGYLHRNVLCVMEGLQSGCFSTEDQNLFYSSTYVVSEESNRMGLRLTGPSLRHLSSSEILTEGVPLGAVQVPQDGKPIILFVEHQTTGGYPKIANVISAHLRLVGQLRPRDSIRFKKVSLEQAGALLQDQERFIHSLPSR